MGYKTSGVNPVSSAFIAFLFLSGIIVISMKACGNISHLQKQEQKLSLEATSISTPFLIFLS